MRQENVAQMIPTVHKICAHLRLTLYLTQLSPCNRPHVLLDCHSNSFRQQSLRCTRSIARVGHNRPSTSKAVQAKIVWIGSSPNVVWEHLLVLLLPPAQQVTPTPEAVLLDGQHCLLSSTTFWSVCSTQNNILESCTLCNTPSDLSVMARAKAMCTPLQANQGYLSWLDLQDGCQRIFTSLCGLVEPKLMPRECFSGSSYCSCFFHDAQLKTAASDRLSVWDCGLHPGSSACDNCDDGSADSRTWHHCAQKTVQD